MNNSNKNNDIQQIIVETLTRFQDAQLNLASAACRELLAEKIAARVNEHVTGLIEDIVCPPTIRDEDGEVRIW